MKNWINQHKKKYQVPFPPPTRGFEIEEAVPVSALLELFSKDGEQLAREMYPITLPKKQWLHHLVKTQKQEAFLEAYNLQQVNIDSSMLDIDSLLSEFERQGISTENWDGEDGAERAIVDGVQNLLIEKDDKIDALKKEVEDVTATCKKWYDAAMYFQDMGKIGINMEDPNMRKIPDPVEFDPNRPDIY
jgi:uncharacterized protein YecA (UPF0149 family)